MSKKTALAKLLALVEGWFDFVEKRTLPGGCFVNAVSSEYRARPGRIRESMPSSLPKGKRPRKPKTLG